MIVMRTRGDKYFIFTIVTRKWPRANFFYFAQALGK